MAKKFQENLLNHNREKGYMKMEEKHLPDYDHPFVPKHDKKQVNGQDCVCLYHVSVRQIHYNPAYPEHVSVGVHWPYFAKEWVNVAVPISDFLAANPDVGIDFRKDKMEVKLPKNRSGKPYLTVPLRQPMVRIDFYDKNGEKIFGEVPPEYIYAEYERERRNYKERTMERLTESKKETEEINRKSADVVSDKNSDISDKPNVVSDKWNEEVRQELYEKSDELATKVTAQPVRELTEEELLTEVASDVSVDLESLGIDTDTLDMFSL